MVLTPHMLIGAAIGSQVSSSWLAFLFGLISHYLIDSIPHWEYIDRANASDPGHVKQILLDFVIGIILILALVWSDLNMIIVIAVMGSILPDFLHGMCYNFNIKWLKPHLLMHHKIHSFKRLSFWQGVPMTVMVSLAAILVLIL